MLCLLDECLDAVIRFHALYGPATVTVLGNS
jgi:hypothetical protein